MAKRKKTAVQKSVSVLDLLSSYSDIESLKDEMVEWKENMESNSMEALPKFEEVSECADSLETVYDDLERAVGELETLAADCEPLKAKLESKVDYQYFPFQGRHISRASRLDDATTDIGRAIDALNDWLTTEPAIEKDGSAGRLLPADTYAEIEAAIQEIEAATNECCGIDFPGMY